MYKEKTETCGKRIEKALNIRKMKQAELCKLANVPKSSLSLYLRGAYEPKQDKIYNMATVLNVSEIWLMGYDVPMERDVITSPAPIMLTDSERIMLELFRRISESQQEVLIQMVQGALNTLE
jgi:transcriptional regulator with XRE-family HTH domain